MKIKTSLITLFIAVVTFAYGQDKKTYSTTIIEFPFTWSNATDNDEDVSGGVRFAPFFNFQNNLNVDFSEKAGLFLGLGIHNVGFIYDESESVRKKVRSYNLGIPVGFKIGNMGKSYIYAGYEFEVPFAYKEKEFVNEEKVDKWTKWFSDRTPLQQSFMVGVQLPQGANLKFKYYFTNFYDQDYSEINELGQTETPYANFNANVFWISLNMVLLRNSDLTY